jgi:hypothetical protein
MAGSLRAVSEVSICSNALIRIGSQAIASLDDDSNRARTCKSLWPHIRDAELRDHNWNSSILRKKLQLLASAPVAGFAYQYQLPDDYLFLIEVVGAEPQTPYKIESGKFLTDLTEVYIRYVAATGDPAGWDALLVDVFTWRMAKELALPITGSVSVRDRMDAEYTKALPKARTRDGQEDFPQVIPANDLIDVRMGLAIGTSTLLAMIAAMG